MATQPIQSVQTTQLEQTVQTMKPIQLEQTVETMNPIQLEQTVQTMKSIQLEQTVQPTLSSTSTMSDPRRDFAQGIPILPELRNMVYEVALRMEREAELRSRLRKRKTAPPTKATDTLFYGLTQVSHQSRIEFAPMWYAPKTISLPMRMVQDYLSSAVYPAWRIYLSEGLALLDDRIDLIKLFATLTNTGIRLNYGATVLYWLIPFLKRSNALIIQGKIEAVYMLKQPAMNGPGVQTVVLIKVNKELGEEWMEQEVIPAALAAIWRGWEDNVTIYYTSEAWKGKKSRKVDPTRLCLV